LKYDFLSFFKNLEEVYERETNDNSAREIDPDPHGAGVSINRIF
jgi:hypothetical protein